MSVRQDICHLLVTLEKRKRNPTRARVSVSVRNRHANSQVAGREIAISSLHAAIYYRFQTSKVAWPLMIDRKRLCRAPECSRACRSNTHGSKPQLKSLRL